MNPIFLNRTLSYMRARDRPRRDAYAKRRKNLKLQDLYEKTVEEETRKKVGNILRRSCLDVRVLRFIVAGPYFKEVVF